MNNFLPPVATSYPKNSMTVTRELKNVQTERLIIFHYLDITTPKDAFVCLL